jgi:hypothetical protein
LLQAIREHSTVVPAPPKEKGNRRDASVALES